jgi:nucleoside-diphosphate-sugar epimerase
MRGEQSPTLLLTGATGFLGSHLAVELLERGNKVALLCRPSGKLNARERVAQRLSWFGYDISKNPRCRIVEGRLEEDRLGLVEEDYTALLESVDEIIHCAADTSFAERKRRQVEAANVKSLRNLLELAKGGCCYFFHLVSTVFVAGKRRGPCREELPAPQGFHNVYEETKYLAELEALETCEPAGIRLNIFRPSIVFGNSRNGRSFRFTALYYPLKLIDYLRSLFLRDIRDNGGRYAKEMGVRRRENGTLAMPIRIENGHEESLNVIPIDYFVNAALALMEQSLEGDIFHIVSPEPVSLARIIEYAQRYFGIDGIEPVSEEEYARSSPNSLETLVQRQLGAYLPYMRDRRHFLQDKASAILDAKGTRCPGFDYPFFERCVSWALEMNWGRKPDPNG